MCKDTHRSSPFRSTLNASYITGLDMCKDMHRSSPFRSTLNTSYITGLDMCKVCTEAVHCVALSSGNQKRALREKNEEKLAVPMMGGGCTTARADRHPEGTTRGPFFIAQALKCWQLDDSKNHDIVLQGGP